MACTKFRLPHIPSAKRKQIELDYAFTKLSFWAMAVSASRVSEKNNNSFVISHNRLLPLFFLCLPCLLELERHERITTNNNATPTHCHSSVLMTQNILFFLLSSLSLTLSLLCSAFDTALSHVLRAYRIIVMLISSIKASERMQ